MALSSSPRIRELPEHVRNQIAAGEVVERPASVVKELVENAVDAGATEIRVDLAEGGIRLVKVTDNGVGMGAEDLALAFRPHATSKLQDASDLEHVASLGFRGEALASIGSVARVRLISRSRDRDGALRIDNEGGSISGVREVGGPPGTSVEVRDLFYNVPARRKFLKRASTELGRVLDVLQRLALAQEGVGFQVTHEKKRVFDVEASMDLLARIQRIFGADLAQTLQPVEGAREGIRLHGYVAPPHLARRDTSRQMWFLNGRPLKDRLLSRIVKQGYHGFLDGPKQPVAFLALSMDPQGVDVNVHPQKAEVRFRDERHLFGFLVNRLKEAVARTDMATPGESLLRRVERRESMASAQPTLPDPGALPARPAQPAEPLGVYEVPGRPYVPTPEREARSEPAAQDPWARGDEFQGPYLQVNKTYLLRALPDGFEIVDQHALHERLTFEGLKAQLARGKVEVQQRLVPELVELTRDEVQALSEHLEALADIGIEATVFGPTTIAVHGLPALLQRSRPDTIVRDLVALVMRGQNLPEAGELLEDLLHSRACRSSIMAGDELSQGEIRSLLERASKLEHDQTCPHGRPTRVRFTLADLEKAFHRR